MEVSDLTFAQSCGTQGAKAIFFAGHHQGGGSRASQAGIFFHGRPHRPRKRR